MTPGRLCDLIFYWMREGCKDENEWYKTRSQFEVPPLGYTGSLAGTGWDQDVMLDEYQQASGEVNR